MDDILVKPVRIAHLKAMMEKWCPGYNTEPFDSDEVALPTPSTDVVDTINQDALSFREALSLHDITQAIYFIHRIRGASMMFGYVDLAVFAAGTEQLLEEGSNYDTGELFKSLEEHLEGIVSARVKI